MRTRGSCASNFGGTPRRALLGVLTGADAATDRIGGIPPYFMPEAWGGPKGYATMRPVLLCETRALRRRPCRLRGGRDRSAGARRRRTGAKSTTSRCQRSSTLRTRSKPTRRAIWDDCPNGNVGMTIAFGDKAATDAAFAKAKHIVSLRLQNNRITANAIEPRCALGLQRRARARYTLYTTSQNPHGVRPRLPRRSSTFRKPKST